MRSQRLAEVAPEVVARVQARRAAARDHLDVTVRRRERAYRELITSKDPVDQIVARVYLDFLLQVEEVTRSEAAMLLAAGPGGDPVVGRIGVFDDERDLLVVPWHAPEGQRLLLAADRLVVTEQDDGLALHQLTADPLALASRIREQMRAAATRERMADPLATLTDEQGEALTTISGADGDVLLTGPPGSGKSAILIMELARRILARPEATSRLRSPDADFEVLFVTGTPRLAERAAALGRLLGIASIRPVPQAEVLTVLGAGEGPTPIAGRAGEADAPVVPLAIEREFDALRDRLHDDDPVPHPLGPVDPTEVGAVRRCRAQAASQPYATSATALRDDLVAEYERLLPGERSRELALAAARQLRPVVTPSELVRRALADLRLPRPLRAAAVACARTLLEGSPRRRQATWDLVVVDEYQRLPAVVLWLLRRSATTALLSGDPRQSFTTAGVVTGPEAMAQVALTTSLRLPTAIRDWIDAFWREYGLDAPGIVSAAPGGEVRTDLDGSHLEGPPPPGRQVLAAASAAERRHGWLSPLDALGLEWPEVVLVDPERILAEHGPPGLFIAATRAIDTLTVVAPAHTRPV